MIVVMENEENLENLNPNAGEVKKMTEGKENPPAEISKKGEHPLENVWKFWYYQSGGKMDNWELNLNVVGPFATVEDFWSIFHEIKTPSNIRNGCSYYVFKEGIKPMWEDDGNKDGGSWLINFDRKSRQLLDDKWLEVLLCLIGEAFDDDDGDDICGAVVDVRSTLFRISVWTSDCKNKDRVMNIGQKIKERLNPGTPLTYKSHCDTANKTASMSRATYVL